MVAGGERDREAPASAHAAAPPVPAVPASGTRPYLLGVADLLWPEGPAAEVHGRKDVADGALTFRALPNARFPRLLVPVPAREAAAAVRAYGGHGTRGTRARTAAVAAVLSLRLGDVVFRDRVTVGSPARGISAELAKVLGHPVRLAVRGGPPRANRKPVLAVLDPAGGLRAFAKIGTGPLPATLVQAEAAALGRLSRHRGGIVRAPRLLHAGSWQDMPLIVQQALPLRRSGAVRPAALGEAMREVAGLGGTGTAPWRSSASAAQVRDRLHGAPRSNATVVLQGLVDALDRQDVELPLGAWHGDWTPWNCAAADGSVAVWDWERFSTGVPVGMDLLHYELQTAVARPEAISPDLPRALLATAPQRLASWGLNAPQARVTAAAYLVEICSRYLVDDQAETGARVGALDAWLLPVLSEAMEQLDGGTTESER